MTEKDQIAELEAKLETATKTERKKLIAETNQLRGTLGMPNYESLKVPGEKEALELVKYHEEEWKRITKGINLRDFDWTREMLKKSVFDYNQLQRLKPYGSYFYLSPEGVIEERETESLIEQSREATYKIVLSAKGLPTKNIEDLTLTEAKKYYEAITKEISDIKKQIGERKKKSFPFSLLSNDLFRAKERCALALRVIGELSEGVIPQTMLREYEKILWDPTKSKQNSEGNPEEPKYLWEEELIRYHFGGFGNKMYFLSGYLAILKDPEFSEEEKESAKKNVPEVFAWIKRKYDQIPFSELSKSPFYDDLKPLFEINKLLSALEEELERKPLDFDKIESILSKIRGYGKEYTKAVDKYYRELTGKDLGAATVETRALMEYRSKEQIEDQARWLKEQGIEPNSFEKAAMEYYGVSIPKEKPPPEVKEKELKEEYARYIDRLRQLGVEIDKVPAIVEIGKTPTVIGKYDTYRLNFALGEISREDMPKFTTLTIKGKVWNVKKSTEAELLKIKLRKKLREEERREKQLKLREERRLETYENKGDGESISLRDKLEAAWLKR